MFNMMHVKTPADANDTDAKMDLGTIVYHKGVFYRYIKNAEAATAWAAGDLIMYDDSGMDSGLLEVTGDVLKGNVAGLAVGVVTALKHGFVAIGGGPVTYHAKGTVALGDPLSPSGATAKKLVKSDLAQGGAGTDQQIIAVALEAATDADAKCQIKGLL
jgi:hypothetical protein